MAAAKFPPSIAALLGWSFGLVGFVVGCRPFDDNSLFTHIATGRLMLEAGLPRTDPYSFTAAGQPWIVQSWLVSLVYGALERLAGIGAVRLCGALLVAALMLLAWRLTRPARSLLARVGLMGLVLLAGVSFWSPRPLLFGLVLLGTTLVIVTEHHDPRWLVPLFWLWVNSHGSFPIGVLAVACLALGSWLDGDRRRDPWMPLGWAVGGTFAGAVSPGGPALLKFPLEVLSRMEILQRVVEWQSPNFSSVYARVFLAQVLLAVVVLVRRPSYRSAIPLVAFTALALTGQRSIPNAGLMLLPGLALGLEGLGGVDGRDRSPLVLAAGAVLTATSFVAASTMLARPAFDLGGYPTDAVAWLDQRGLMVPGTRLATQDTMGNTLELLYGTRVRVFFDDRYDLYPLSVSRDYLAVHEASATWEEALARYDVQYLLWPRSAAIARLVAASGHWRIVYQDPTTFVACRRESHASEC